MTQSNNNSDSEKRVPEDRLSKGEKCLVLGSTGYTGIDSVEWNSKEFPNIIDYDVVIVDVRALNEKMLATVTNKSLETLRTQLTRLLHSKGRIIVVSDYQKTHKRPKQYPESANNYEWCPVTIGISNESGESLVQISQRFSRYIKHLKNWPYFFFIPRGCLSRELTNFFGSTHDTKYSLPLSSFVENRYKKTIAGSLRIEVTNKQRKSDGYSSYDHYSEKPNAITGEIILLPLIEKLDHKEAVRLVLEDLIGTSLGYEPPSWVESIEVPHVSELETEIKEKETEIDLIASDIGKLEIKLEKVNDHRLKAGGFILRLKAVNFA